MNAALPSLSWRTGRLGDLVEFQRGFDITVAQQSPGPIPVISSSGISSYHSEARARGPGVIIGRKGTLGGVYFSDVDYWPHDTTLWSTNFFENCPRFVYYFMRTMDVQRFNVGNANPTLNRNHIRDLPVLIPPVEVQERVAEILGAYDELVAINERRTILLEEAARHLYREWFVRLRFPGAEHVKVSDGVPSGWERSSAADAMLVNPRTRLSGAEEQWSVEMADLSVDSMVIATPQKRASRSGSKFQNGDTLFARITPCLENGKTGFVSFLQEGETARGSTEFIVFRAKRLSPEAVYCLARLTELRDHAIKSMIGASGRQRVQESCFQRFSVLIPPDSIAEHFTSIVRPMFQQIRVLTCQNQKLRTARDLLLPRLMSGQIAV